MERAAILIEGSLGGEVLVFAMVTMRSMNDE
jgi:hypothetical protein